jgi:AraC family transcriptional regulator of adaptative response / DNA-3-methyladenine glycosylase II
MRNTRALRIAIEPPYDVDWMLTFLARRAIPGIEHVVGDRYERRLDGDVVVSVRLTPGAALLRVPRTLDAEAVRERMRRLLDLDADSGAIDGHLARDAVLRDRVVARPGLRVPGAWDAYELAIRAVLGQQVSVDRATQLARRLVDCYGVSGAFPAPHLLASSNPAALGMPGRRGEAIRRLAAHFAASPMGEAPSAAQLRAVLLAIPGIGPWTAEYVAMRAGRDPDAFPASDWVVLKELDTTPARARDCAVRWRPYRAYAVMYLWAAAARRREQR